MKVILRDLIQTIALSPDEVSVSRLTVCPGVFRIKVARRDFQLVLNRLPAIKVLATQNRNLSFARKMLLQLEC